VVAASVAVLMPPWIYTIAAELLWALGSGSQVPSSHLHCCAAQEWCEPKTAGLICILTSQGPSSIVSLLTTLLSFGYGLSSLLSQS
jgi:hypothetical protein